MLMSENCGNCTRTDGHILCANNVFVCTAPYSLWCLFLLSKQARRGVMHHTCDLCSVILTPRRHRLERKTEWRRHIQFILVLYAPGSKCEIHRNRLSFSVVWSTTPNIQCSEHFPPRAFNSCRCPLYGIVLRCRCPVHSSQIFRPIIIEILLTAQCWIVWSAEFSASGIWAAVVSPSVRRIYPTKDVNPLATLLTGSVDGCHMADRSPCFYW